MLRFRSEDWERVQLVVHFFMPKHLNISEARARLTEMAHRIADSPGRVEYITHRDLEDDIAMTTRSHLRFLEDSRAQLRSRATDSFRLAESMSTECSEEEVEAALAAVKRRAEELEELRGQDLAR